MQQDRVQSMCMQAHELAVLWTKESICDNKGVCIGRRDFHRMPSHIPGPVRPIAGRMVDWESKSRAASEEQHTRFRPSDAIDVDRTAT